jgi:hypothetical protein
MNSNVRLLKICRLSMTLFIISATALSATAQQPSSSPEAKLQSSTSVEAKLFRVDEGIFELKHGRMIDITDKKVLFQFTGGDGPERIYMKVNGGSTGMSVGGRFSFKNFGADCFMDLIDLVQPKGAPETATFRLVCN